MTGLLYYMYEVKIKMSEDFDYRKWINPGLDRIRQVPEFKVPKIPEIPRADVDLINKANKATLDSLEVLKQIEMNTEYLKDIVDLLSVNNENQKELSELVQSILNIAKAPDKEEAQSRYRSVMKHIGNFSTITTSTLNVVKLSSLAATILQFFMQSH